MNICDIFTRRTTSKSFLSCVIVLSIDLYSHLVSPVFRLLGFRCRFFPSCSKYAREAFQQLNFFKAARYSIWRVIRCGPWSDGGFDPVPKR